MSTTTNGTITSGTVAQAILAAGHSYLGIVFNNDSNEDMRVRVGATASSSTGTVVAAGTSKAFGNLLGQTVSLYGTTTGKAFSWLDGDAEFWGSVTGDITNQSDLTDYVATQIADAAPEDASGNLIAPNVSAGFATTATAAGNTTLDVTSAGVQQFTGSTTQNCILPVVSTLPQTGFPFVIINDSSGAVTVKSSGGNTVQAIAAGHRAFVYCIALTGTSAASWAVIYV